MNKKVYRSIARRSLARSRKEIKALVKNGDLDSRLGDVLDFEARAELTVEKLVGGFYYHLSDHEYGDFIPVVTIPKLPYYSGKEPSYGGAQVWWSNQSYKDSSGNKYGCGVMAATNLIIYLGKHFMAYKALVKPELVGGDNGDGYISHKNYMKLADELWRDLSPYCGLNKLIYHSGRDPYTAAYPFGFGVTVSKMTEGLKRYALRRGIDLSFSKIKARYATDQQGVDYIKNNLRRNNPVLLLSLRNGVDQFEFHWVMITELYENQSDSLDQISIATWGDKRSKIDFNLLWNYGFFMENQYMISVISK